MEKLKFRQIYIIKEIFYNGSLSKVAHKMGLTTAAVSKSCLDFEKYNGIQLFHRSKDGMIPTSFCKELIGLIESIEENVQILSRRIDSFKQGLETPVRIGFQGGACQIAVFNILSTFPDFLKNNIGLYCHDRHELMRLFEKGDLDVIYIITNGMERDDKFRKMHVASYNSFVIDRDECLSFRHVISNWHIYGVKTWALPPLGFAVRSQFNELLRTNDLAPPENIIEYNNAEILKKSAEIRDVCAIVPEYRVKELLDFRKVRGLRSALNEMQSEPHLELNMGLFIRSDKNNYYIISRISDFHKENKLDIFQNGKNLDKVRD